MVEPVDAFAAAPVLGAVPAAVGDEDTGELGVDEDVVGVLDVVASFAPVTPALRGEEEL